MYVRFGGEYWETYHRNMTRRRVLSLHNQIVKQVNTHFSGQRIPLQLEILIRDTRRLKALSERIADLTEEARKLWLPE